MRYFFFLLLFFAVLNTAAQKAVFYVAARTGLSVREKPDATAKVLDKIPFGTKITLTEDEEERTSIKTEGMTGYWRKVSYNGKTGYIIDSYLFSSPVPKATVKELKGYLAQLSLPFGTKLIIKSGTMANIEESGYELHKQLYKNGAEWHHLMGYEYGADTYFIPDFNLQQAFLLLRMIPEFKDIFGEKDEFPTMSRKYKRGEIDYEITVDKIDFGGEDPWIKRITVEYSDGASYEFEMFELNNQIVITLSSGV